MPPNGRPLRIGCGAGYSNDRIEPAVELVERGDLDYIVFECLAERTIALAQQAKARDPQAGFDPLLRLRMEAVLASCHERGVTLITNMGAANPHAAAGCVRDVARRAGLTGLTVAVVTGDEEPLEAEVPHHRDLVSRHGALRIRLVVGRRRRFAAVAVTAEIGGDDGEVARQERRNLVHITCVCG